MLHHKPALNIFLKIMFVDTAITFITQGCLETEHVAVGLASISTILCTFSYTDYTFYTAPKTT